MSLAAWQRALAELVVARAAGSDESLSVHVADGLSAAERQWLERLSASAGFDTTCEVQRWWREFRVQMAAPLTLGALDADRRSMLVAEYIRRFGRPSSFFLTEALPFLQLTAELAADVPHVPSLAAFEHAMLRLGDALANDPTLVQVGDAGSVEHVEAHPLAEVVRFQAPPGQVLAATARGVRLPDVELEPHWILIAPAVPNLAALCTPAEASLFETARDQRLSRPELQSNSALAPAFRRLWDAGALRRSG